AGAAPAGPIPNGPRTTAVFDWLFEGQTTVYVLLGTLLLACFFIYWQYRRRAWLYAMAVVVALIGLYWLLDRLVETDREQVQREVEALAADVRGHRHDAVYAHLAEDFRSPRDSDRAAFRKDTEWMVNSVTQ